MDQLGKGVITVTREFNAPAQAVWDVLADGWFYATWVVGASRVRGVDEGWPAEGTRIHHSFGVWPAVVSDTTHVLRSVPPTELVLRAKGWPAGEAEVVITVTPAGGESCTGSIQASSPFARPHAAIFTSAAANLMSRQTCPIASA